MLEKRSEQRFMCSDLVNVRLESEAGPQEVIANLEDISPSGACVHLEAATQKGADIEIVCANCRLKGKVAYCRFVEIGYDVGIAFDQPRTWKRRQFRPKHLLNIPAGGCKEHR